MNRKGFLGVLILLLFGGGIFLWQQQQRGQSSTTSITPTKWSQAGDYKITESSEGTIVQNKKAGFSFEVPEGWKIKDEGNGLEYFLNLLSPDAEFDEDNFLLEGCFINIETISHESAFINTSELIRYLKENPETDPNRKVVTVGERQGLQSSTVPEVTTNDPRILKRVRDTLQVEIPLTANTLVDLELLTKKSTRDRCVQSFEQFLFAISFE